MLAGGRWVLAVIDDAFGEQAIATADATAINEQIAPHFDAILTASDPRERHLALDRLIAVWCQLEPRLGRLS